MTASKTLFIYLALGGITTYILGKLRLFVAVPNTYILLLPYLGFFFFFCIFIFLSLITAFKEFGWNDINISLRF